MFGTRLINFMYNNKRLTDFTYFFSITYYLFDKLDDIVNEYKNTYHKTIQMKPIVVKSSTYIVFGKESNEKNPKFEVGDYVKISKYKIFAKGYAPN